MKLATDLPASCLTDGSLNAVVDGCEFFPAYSVLKTALGTWLEQHVRAQVRGFKGDMVTPYMLEKIMENCNGTPGPMLTSWLNKKGIYPDACGVWPGTSRMVAERADAVRDWSDPAKVQVTLRSLVGHPMEAYLRRMLHGLVQKHAPQNLGLFDTASPVAVAFPALAAPEIGHSMFGED